ncbi:MAG TPA: hypothetical protein VLV54_20790, partial [Thermoanaerobaculia bacterium]|nr:hypothetical protein [Thermoanaerobaculia bacterium]
MAGKAGTLETLAHHVGLALQPLQDRLAAGNVIGLFAELGLRFPPELLQPALVNSLNAGVAAAGQLSTLVSQLVASIEADDEAGILQAGEQLIQQISTTISTLEQIDTQLRNLAASLPGMNASEVTSFAQELPSRLLSYLLISYLESLQPGVVGLGIVLGVLDYRLDPGGNDAIHPPFIRRKLQLSRLGDALGSPADLLRTLYGWGDPGFDGTVLIPALNTALNLLGDPSEIVSPGPGNALESSMFSLEVNPASSPPGLAATLSLPIPSGFDLTLPLSPPWSVRAQVQGAFTPELKVILTPPATVSFQPPSGTLSGLLEMDLIAQGADDSHPLLLFGETGGSRLQMRSFTFGAGVTVTGSVTGPAAATPFVRAEVTGGKAVIDLSKGDGFLSQLLSGLHVESDFALKATWDPATGAHFDGSANLELEIPTHLNLGPVELQAIYLDVGLAPGGT